MYWHSKSLFLQVTSNFELNNAYLVIDIQTQILLTILLTMNHVLRGKLKVYIITHTKRETIHHKVTLFAKSIMKVKRVNKIELECLHIILIYLKIKIYSHL